MTYAAEIEMDGVDVYEPNRVDAGTRHARGQPLKCRLSVRVRSVNDLAQNAENIALFVVKSRHLSVLENEPQT